ncbi:MAG: LysM peptidoglycan-binding domain-containing protein [Saprospiraceae bacterium]
MGPFLALHTVLSAGQVFILFDPSCMDRLEFEHSRIDGKNDYFVYHISLRTGTKLVLEVGAESNKESNFVPEPYLHCGSGGFDQGLMRRINAGLDDVFIVYPESDKKFTISQVSTAAYYNKAGNTISYESPRYSFMFNADYGTIGENIAINNPSAKLYFEGRLENDCSGSYLFRQLNNQAAFPLIDLVLTPEIGIVEERLGANAAAAMNNVFTLKKVNGVALSRYLLSVCGAEPGSRGSVVQSTTPQTPTNYGNVGNNPMPAGNLPKGAIVPGGSPVVNTTPPSQGATPVFTNTTTPPTTTTSATASTHTVAAGETLYGIAKKYNVGVNDIKNWNNLSSNTIRKGQVLQVTAPTNPAAGTMTARTPQSGSTLSGAPVPYEQTTTRIQTSDEYHVVQPGETVASIALKYGYTTPRLREINNMGPNDVALVGQRLKISDCHCPDTNTPANPPSTTQPQYFVPASTPNSYETTTASEFTARTPVASGSSVFANTAETRIQTSSNLTTGYRTPTVPGANAAAVSLSEALLPSSYDTPATNRTLSALERNRVIGASDDFGNPLPTSASSPLPPPNRPIDASTLPASYTDAPATKATQRRAHIVSQGESLYGIARRYNTTVEKLRQINKLGPNDPIMEFQTIYLE